MSLVFILLSVFEFLLTRRLIPLSVFTIVFRGSHLLTCPAAQAAVCRL
jgi:hypothetical protein